MYPDGFVTILELRDPDGIASVRADLGIVLGLFLLAFLWVWTHRTRTP